MIHAPFSLSDKGNFWVSFSLSCAMLRIMIFCLLAGSFGALSAQGNWQRFRGLNGPEKRWVLTHLCVAGKAMRVSQKVVALSAHADVAKSLDPQPNGGQVDAFRHGLWMAMLASEIGPHKAKRLGMAHEKGNFRDFRKGKLEDGAFADAAASEMDLWNNARGIALNGEGLEGIALQKRVVELVLAGEMRILARDAAGYFLDKDGFQIQEKDWRGKWKNGRSLAPSNQVFQK